VLACRLDGEERRRYDELRDHYRAALLARSDRELRGDQMHVLEALLRLRQCACHPGLLDRGRKGEGSAKLETLLARLEEVAAEGHKALVFSQFTTLLSIVRDRLDAAGTPYAYLDGRTRKRRDKVERFQSDPACPVFLISLKAGGHGLNLTAADYVFLLDPWWNPAVESQAIDRAHRIGRTRPVHAYRLIAADTVEERIQELQAGKRELAEAIFAEGGGGAITREDLERLLG
jgi:SNF2 family DNA or RNA helicase